MKYALFLGGLIFLASFAHVAYAEEYQCNISSTRAAECEAYVEIKHTCPFPDELNEQRTEELENGKASYPEFCTICGNESEIPRKCQSGRIAPLDVKYKNDTSNGADTETVDASLNTKSGAGDPRKNSILQNAYGGFKIAVSKLWGFLKEALKGETFELESPTPVAGVRG